MPAFTPIETVFVVAFIALAWMILGFPKDPQ